MRVVHLLRKYNPSEWGGTETAVKRLLDGLAQQRISSVVFAPALKEPPQRDPIVKAGYPVRRFNAFLPVANLSNTERSQLIASGGNLMSLDLPWKLLREENLSLIHAHTLNRLGGIALAIARLRRVPLVATVHGGVLDLPASVRASLIKPLQGHFEWGKIFGWFLRSRQMLEKADAIITCNRREASLLSKKYPTQKVLVQPHGVPGRVFQHDHKSAALQSFPSLSGKTVLLAVGRIDSPKNQGWLVEQFPRILKRHGSAMLVLAGACTDEVYGKTVKKEIRRLGLESHVLLTDGLAPEDPTLVGLYQSATALLLPSISEPFGLVILEAWAAGIPVISSRTSGACDLIQPGENGWFFDLNSPDEFHAAVDAVLTQPELRNRLGKAGQERVRTHFDSAVLSARVKALYESLIEQKNTYAVRDPA